MRYTDAPARREDLLARLAAERYVSSARIASELGVSEMTIRRDLRRLADDGLARRVPGGATLPPASAAQSFDTRSASAAEEKRSIAQTASALLEGVRSVAIDAGTTTAALVEFLPRNVTVISHSMPVLSACTVASDRDVVGLGGFFDPSTRSFNGPATWTAIRELTVDVAVISATALDPRGLYSTNPLDAEVKRALIDVADRVVVLADQHKVGTRADVRFAEPTAVDVLVTDASGPSLDDMRVVFTEVLSVRMTAAPLAVETPDGC